MACAQQLRRAGHAVTLFERDEAGGGLVRFGVPDFKIEKWIVERRVKQLADEGVEFRFGVEVGKDITAAELKEQFDAIVIATGARVPRDLPVPGRELGGVHFAMDYLYQRNRHVARTGPQMPGTPAPPRRRGHHRRRQARDRDRRRRHRRRLRRERAPRGRRVGHADRADRRAAVVAARRQDAVAALADEAPHPVRAEGGRRARLRDLDHRSSPATGTSSRSTGSQNSGNPPFEPVPGTEETRPAELVLLAMGFLGPEQGLLEQLGVERDERVEREGAGATRRRLPGVFAAGDARRGQSLIVWAISEGRRCAKAVDQALANRRS